MSQAAFRSQYARLSDEELLSVAADREHLVPDAAVALDLEIRRRGVKVQSPIWLREPGSPERVCSLQDYDWYQHLSEKKQSMSRFFKDSKLISASIVGGALTWALLVIASNLLVIFRWASFKCPQCNHRFGTDAECWSCGFPRSTEQTP